jgi:hypothetical protein
MAKPTTVAKIDMMTIAFAHGGILPTEITGGAERRVPAHEPVEVPRSYGEHLVTDRFAYDPSVQSKDAVGELQRHDPAALAAAEAAAAAAASTAKRTELEKELTGRRAALAKETDDAKKATLTSRITEIEKQLADLAV